MLSVSIVQQRGDFRLDADLCVPQPGVTCLFGPSGSGKTSIIFAIAGLARPDSGTIEFDGEVFFDSNTRIDLPPERRRIGCVFQDARLFPHLNVEGNLRYGLRRSQPGGHAVSFDTVVDLLGLDKLLVRRTYTLSGGEKQRVGLGRALLSQPRLLLLDEPLASLDQARKMEVLPYIERLRDEFALPVVYVTHDIEEVVRLCDTLVLIERGQVAASGPLLSLSSRTDLPLLSDRTDAGTVLDTAVAAHDTALGLSEIRFGGCRLMVPLADKQIGQRLRVRIPARDVILATARPVGLSVQNMIEGKVVSLDAGPAATCLVGVEAGGVVILARITRNAAIQLGLTPGMSIHALIKSVAIERGQQR